MSRGIDVSHNNGAVDWTKVKASGIDFAIIRAGYGQFPDKEFHANMKGAAAAGLPVGIWYFSYALSIVQAAEEAAHCCGLIKQYKIDLPVYFDFEYASEEYAAKKGVKYDARMRTDAGKAFCERVRAADYTPGIYTNADYITSRLYWNELKGYSLWLASWPYGQEKSIGFADVKDTEVKTTWGKPAIWQIGKGPVPGCPYDTDLNYGYMALPNKVTSAPPTADLQTLKAGDKVRVKNVTASGGVKRGKLYGGGMFVVFYSSYDVLSVSGKRVVIGRGKSVTAAVNGDELEKI